MKRSFTYMALLSIFFSCEKEINYDLPQAKPKLSLYSYLYPGSQTSYPEVRADIGKSSTVFSEGPYWVNRDGLSVFLYEDNILTDTLRYDTVYHTHIGRHNTLLGKKYRIEVQSKDWQTTYGEFIFPEKISILHAQWDTLSNKVSFSFDDPGDVANHYFFRINTYEQGYGLVERFDISGTDVQFFNTEEFDSLLIYEPGEAGNIGYEGYFNDKNFNGALKTIEVRLTPVNPPLENMYIELFHISADLYEYKRTLSAYMATKDNPFAEPVKIHSNIHNGYGIVGAATPTTLEAVKK